MLKMFLECSQRSPHSEVRRAQQLPSAGEKAEPLLIENQKRFNINKKGS